MKEGGRFLWLAAGLLVGFVAANWFTPPNRLVEAGDSLNSDFYISTGEVQIANGLPMDGVWILDYRSGKLLATVIDRNTGKILGWAEVDLVSEFGIQPRQNVHFMMTTGTISRGQSALYLTETTTGKLGVYSMGPRPGVAGGVAIRRHDLVFFRNQNQKQEGN